ncbi:MAG: NAD(P)-binding domain-containing protein [Brumimicrobium sp.]
MKTWGVIGCGWLGLPFATKLINDNCKAYGTTTTESKLDKLVEVGVSPVLLNKEQPQINQPWINSCDYILLNIPPTSFKENYALAMKQLVDNVNAQAKVIFISSTSVYKNKSQIAKEEDHLDGTSRNAPYIVEAERVLYEKLNGNLTVIRMAGLVGGDRNPAKFMAGKEYDGGQEPVNLIHLEDCIGLIDKVVEEKYWGEILNGCATKHPMKSSYYMSVSKQLGITSPKFNDNMVKHKIVSNNKSRNELGYEYKYDSPFEFPLDVLKKQN